MNRSEGGFTLIELLTVIGIIGILMSLGLTSFSFYKASAAFATAKQTAHDARNAIEAAQVDPDNPPSSVPLTSQTSQGMITDPLAAAFLPGLRLPPRVNFQVQYDNTCVTGACQSELVQVNHCSGLEFVRWIRFGDGTEIEFEIAGEGCS